MPVPGQVICKDKMAEDEWRQCANWLVRCRILPDDHKTTNPDASAFDLAQALRDGVLICHLLNNLGPNAVDLKDFSPRPQLSQVCQCFYFVYIYTVYIYLLHVTLMILKW
jgi:guanine nucleotide exchange factor VAV